MTRINRIVIPVRRYLEGAAAMNRLLAYARGFAELGVEVWFYFMITNEKEEKPNIVNPKIHYVYLWEHDNSFLRRFRGLELLKNLFLFRNQVQKNDVLLLYGIEYYLFASALSVSRFSKVFCEITEHPFYHGDSFVKKLNARVSLSFIKKIDGLFVISCSLRDYYIAEGVKKGNVCVINMFVDTNRFTNIIKSNSEKYIAYCGYVSIRKDGVDVLIKAFSKVHTLHPDYKLFIIGRGGFPEPLSFFEDLAEEYGVKDSVVFTGEVRAEEMPQLLVNADILALARPDSLQARNGFPTKLGEYLATGNPIVVTRVGEIPHFIIDGESGVLAEESNVDDFADKLSWVIEHPELAQNIGNNGRGLVESEFSYLEQSKKALSFICDRICNREL